MPQARYFHTAGSVGYFYAMTFPSPQRGTQCHQAQPRLVPVRHSYGDRAGGPGLAG
jgi:hypothetical protein